MKHAKKKYFTTLILSSAIYAFFVVILCAFSADAVLWVVHLLYAHAHFGLTRFELFMTFGLVSSSILLIQILTTAKILFLQKGNQNGKT